MRGLAFLAVFVLSSARGGLIGLTVFSATRAGSENSVRLAYRAVSGNTGGHVQLARTTARWRAWRAWRAAVAGQGLLAAGIAGDRGAGHPFADVRRLPEGDQILWPRAAPGPGCRTRLTFPSGHVAWAFHDDMSFTSLS